ncbi:peptidyl-prolyl cis-trans isomerase, cyclophilin type [Arcticibacter svalbardensis MN12-7]|uniref:Peptidyl-prolyl cis-trans isomerase n=2 Tax=Arcticibacter TaxID=1288026 RepID=R9GM41_9SPHI|nr:peptidyl-prolyl cis-trans isomerase, cyclophilin type [Arcticibacter svalbardensis MN12-7]
MLGLKDSALVKIPSDSLFKDGQMERPSFFPPGSTLQFVLKIENVQSMEEAMAERQKMMDIQTKMADSLKTNELHIADAFVTANKLVVKQTPSGLRYLILTPSMKLKPTAGDTVEVNYIGRTLNGKIFDSSIEAEAKKAGLEQPGRNYEPISFVVGQGEVIPGWDEALLMMNEGSKGRFLIPSELAYGPKGAGQDIPPFSTLDFQVELVKVKPAKKAVVPKIPAVIVKKPVAVKKVAPKTKPTVKKKVVTSKTK